MVKRIQYDLGVFEVRPTTGRTVTVSIPYNAKAADVENFRRLRRGDHVRVEGEFVNDGDPSLGGNSSLRYPCLKNFFHNCLITNDLKAAKG